MSNQVLNKFVKHHNSQNVGQHEYINVYIHPGGISWVLFYLIKLITRFKVAGSYKSVINILKYVIYFQIWIGLFIVQNST
ncbi:hypothetical protein GMD1S_09557 [Streptococcus sp. GMD1S]|nr:hypothetical protein GMD1S_09557 [Streptococcus sp. GMD1S]